MARKIYIYKCKKNAFKTRAILLLNFTTEKVFTLKNILKLISTVWSIATHHIEFELHVEDPSTVKHWHQVDGKHCRSVRGDGDIGPKEDVEVHGKSIQLIA